MSNKEIELVVNTNLWRRSGNQTESKPLRLTARQPNSLIVYWSNSLIEICYAAAIIGHDNFMEPKTIAGV